MRRFEGSVALVTGGGTGIGFASARQIAEEGGRVILLGRQLETLEAAVGRLPGDGHRTEAVDCADEKAVKAVVSALSKELGKFSVAVLNAGAHELRPLAVANNDHFESQFRANVLTAVATARAFVKAAHPEGASIVMVSSAAAVKGGAAAGAYSTAKAGLLGLARVLAVELAPRKIRVNTVIPGVVRTEMTERFFANLSPEQIEEIEKAHPLGVGEPVDVARSIAFLASDDARWVTGTEIVVDGGFSSS